MSRPFARLKLGYYPLPVEEARNVRSLLVSSASYAAIDPCAGNGTALLEVTKDTGARLAAIEADADRAAGCIQRGITTVHGSVFECKVQADSCSLLYLNPPYDTELGPHGNRRMELVFLEHCYRWVRTDGVLVFVIPIRALNSCARLLASQFDRVTMFRLEHPEPEQVKKILGDPSISTPEKLVYYFGYKEKTPPKALAELRKEHPKMNDAEFRKNYEYFLSDHFKSSQRLSLQNRPTEVAVQD